MLPTAVIAGRVTDEDGDPMQGVRVLVQRKKPGKAGREAAGTEATNDLGEYRIAGLFPGQYWVVAMPPPDVRDYEPQHQKSSTSDSQAETRYFTTYYPGTLRCCADLDGNAQSGRRNAGQLHTGAARALSRPRHRHRPHRRPRSLRLSCFLRQAMLTGRTRRKLGRTGSSKCVGSHRDRTLVRATAGTRFAIPHGAPGCQRRRR